MDNALRSCTQGAGCYNSSMQSLRQLLLLSATASLLALSACSGNDDADNEATEAAEKNETVDVLYDKAQATFDKKQFKQAIDDFEEVERQHPYSEWAPRAQLMAAY